VVVSWLFLALSLSGAWFTFNVYRPRYANRHLAVLSFFAGWLTTELALHHIAWQALATAGFVWAGALRGWPGIAGLAVTVVSWMGLVRIFWRARGTEAVVERALETGLGERYRERILPEVGERLAPGVNWKHLLLPFPLLHPEVERVRNVLYAHGGAWMVGSKNEQGLPLLIELASRGWVCVSANYRLSPRATFPDPLVDLKRAIGWIREHAAEYGADADFLVVAGGSAGGHLAAMLALTQNDPEYQPGFERVDTSVRGCVALYGVYDFTDRVGHWRNAGLDRLLERYVMKAPLADARAAYEKASPMSRITADAPPFFVVHGDHDTLVPVGEARHFCELFRRTATAPLVYAEVPGAQHAFETLPSLRSGFVVHGVARFLAYLYSAHLTSRGRGTMTAAAS
jgi:acetyl esterase/lipase